MRGVRCEAACFSPSKGEPARRFAHKNSTPEGKDGKGIPLS